jgi:hypothetical protein
VHGHTAPHVSWGDKLGHVGHDDHNWTVARHTQFLLGPCHDLCPTLWNHVSSGKHQLMVDWDRTRTIRNVALNTDIEWRLNSYCVNDRCPYHIATMAGNFEGCGASSGTLSVLSWSCCAKMTDVHSQMQTRNSSLKRWKVASRLVHKAYTKNAL